MSARIGWAELGEVLDEFFPASHAVFFLQNPSELLDGEIPMAVILRGDIKQVVTVLKIQGETRAMRQSLAEG